MEDIKSRFSNKTLGVVILGSIYAIVTTLVLVLIFALLIMLINIPDGFIMPINQLIKIISIFVGTLVLRGKEKGLTKGFIIGFIYSLLALIIFSFLSSSLSFSWSTLVDIVFGTIIGGICGIICVNFRHK